MEEVSIPKYFPRKEASYFKDALLARNSGKTLAALLYLRVFIEQFARRIAMIEGRESGDVILDSYAGTITPAVREQIPSLKEWYGKISEALHEAREDATVLEQGLEAVDRHFDFRRLYNLDQ